MSEQVYCVEDWRNTSHCLFQYFDDLTIAENVAITIMDSLPFRWCRCEHGGDYMEFAEYPAIGTPRIYVRISTLNEVQTCSHCKQDIAWHYTARGKLCESCYQKQYKITD